MNTSSLYTCTSRILILMLTRPNTRFSGECVYASEHVIYDFTSESETRRSEAESSLFWETPPSASSKSHLFLLPQPSMGKPAQSNKNSLSVTDNRTGKTYNVPCVLLVLVVDRKPINALWFCYLGLPTTASQRRRSRQWRLRERLVNEKRMRHRKDYAFRTRDFWIPLLFRAKLRSLMGMLGVCVALYAAQTYINLTRFLLVLRYRSVEMAHFARLYW